MQRFKGSFVVTASLLASLPCMPLARAQTPLALEYLLDDPALQLGKNPHAVPLRRSDAALAEHPSAQLTYHGGPLLTNAQIYPVFWGPYTWYINNLVSFYQTLGRSYYATVWNEYSPPGRSVGYADYAGGNIMPTAPAGRQIDDREIQRQLADLIRRGVLPRNTSGNLLFAIHFPPNVVITAGPNTSCIDFCGYHSTFILDGVMHYFMVVPDHGGGCNDACGVGGSDQLQRSAATASHLLAGAITNPAVGVAAGVGPPMGWYDAAQGEIGDACLGRLDVVGGWTVQQGWSNAAQACVAYHAQ